MSRLKNIAFSNMKELEKVKIKISKEGLKKFHVISDFDGTLTKEFVNDKRIPSIISILREERHLTEDYPEKAHALFDKYYPIEKDSKISVEEKKKAMHKWWMEHFDLLIKSGLNRKDIRKVVESNKIQLREGALEFFDILNEHKIPLVIFSSSGIGDAIPLLIGKYGKLYKNIHVISNLFEWDKNGKAIKVKQPIIHSMNKDEHSIKNHSIFSVIKDRKNVLLLGDHLGDLGMIKEFNYKNLIKIGFLNDEVKDNIEKYERNFDVVISNDSPMEYVNQLLKELF